MKLGGLGAGGARIPEIQRARSRESLILKPTLGFTNEQGFMQADGRQLHAAAAHDMIISQCGGEQVRHRGVNINNKVGRSREDINYCN